ncbi:hypothetical protein B0H14DRAFT_2895703 [Mycena olivaceomarginata]|nr:hypothetical protein B0H14DRAFT_2895703 [Mycena olivaceomarginata]
MTQWSDEADVELGSVESASNDGLQLVLPVSAGATGVKRYLITDSNWAEPNAHVPSSQSVCSLRITPHIHRTSAFADSYIPRPVALSFREQAQSTFKQMVERSHLPDSPVDDTTSLGNRTNDLYDFSNHAVQGLNPSTPQWISVQERTISEPRMSPQMKQVLFCLSFVLSTQTSAQDAGFFLSLHRVQVINAIGNKAVPVTVVAPGDSEAIIMPPHNYEFIFKLNKDNWADILSLYQEEFRLQMCGLMEDWLIVILALLEHCSPAQKASVLDAYSQYFLSLAQIEEQASLSAYFPSFQGMQYTAMKIFAQDAARTMFESIAREMFSTPVRFPTETELDNARALGNIMCLWTLGSNSMPSNVHDVHENYFLPALAQARQFLRAQLAPVDHIPLIIPRYMPIDIVRQLQVYRSHRRALPFRLYL